MAHDSDDRLQRPQSWGALRALECLTPPSPSPSGSLGALATLASLGDLPIFLHTSDSSLPQDLNFVLQSPERPKTAYLAPSASTTTVYSTNTFGVPNTPGPQCEPDVQDFVTPDDASDCTFRPPKVQLAVSTDPSYLSAMRPSRSGGYFSNRFASLSDLSHFTISAYMDSWASNENLAASPNPASALSPSGSIIISPADDGGSSPASPSPFSPIPPFPSTDSLAARPASPRLAPPPARSWSTISSVLFSRRGISPSPSATSTLASDDNSPRKARFPFSLKNSGSTRSSSTHSDLDTLASRSASPTPVISKPIPSAPVSPARSRHHTRPRPLPVPGASGGSGSTLVGPGSKSGISFGSGPGSGCASGSGSGSGSRHSHPPQMFPPVENLPEVLGWLREACIELWIDQEGFRAIRPKFRLADYTAGVASDPASSLAHGIAVFRPTRRQGAIYHHGTLDSAPVLRRLTLAENEEKDYISRHASLTIKANGIYTVSGTEWFENHHPGHGHGKPLELKWRFEYAVGDRRPDSARHPNIVGEKTFVPLEFSCSPGLLHPTHGKRIKLMHVLMKNITPKLSAKRASVDASSVYSDLPPPVTTTEREQIEVRPLGRARGYSAHRRARSTDQSGPSVWPPADGAEKAKKARPVSVSAASPRVVGNSGTMHASRLSAHILSAEELAEIMENVSTSAEPAMPTRHNWALSPPSHHRHRRTASEMDPVDELGVVTA